MHDCDVNVFTESWANDQITNNFLAIADYQIFRRDRDGRSGGGLLCYVRETIDIQPLEFHNPLCHEVLSLYSTKLNHLFIILYHPYWNNNEKDEELIDLLFQVLHQASCKFRQFDYKFTVLGDFNGLANKMGNFCSVFQLQNVVNFPTRGPSKLDCCLTTNADQYTCNKLAPIGKSDHCLFKCSPKKKQRSKNYFYRYVPNYSPSNKIKFEGLLYDCEFFVGGNIRDVNELNFQYDTFVQKIDSLIQHCFPLRRIKVNRNNLPWINDTIRHCIKKRDYFYKKQNVPKFKHFRSKVKLLLHQARTAFMQSVYNLSQKESWDKLKSFSYLIKQKRESHNVTAPELLQYFTSVRNCAHVELNNDFDSASSKTISITESDVCESMDKVKKGGGYPYIPTWLIKKYGHVFIKPLQHFFSGSLQLNTVPNTMKMATISPIPKTNSPSSPKDYRPITSASPFLKCLETILIDKWFKPLSNEKTFDDQFAFVPLPGRGCTSALVCIYGHAVYNLDRGNYVNLVLVDFSKAFDRANKISIINQLLKLGATQQCALWTYSFLSNRNIRVRLGESISEFASLDVGTPQGSKLSPLLFAFLCAGLKNINNSCKYIKYADDLTIIHTSQIGSDSSSLLIELEHIDNWCKDNNMLINFSKTKILHISGRKKPAQPVIKISGHEIECVQTAKLLGLTFQHNLKWSEHISMSVKKASRLFYVILRLKKCGCNRKVLLQFYKSLVRPHLAYASAATSNMTQQNIKTLQKAEKRFTKIIESPCEPQIDQFLLKNSNNLKKQVLQNTQHPIRQLFTAIPSTATRKRRTLEVKKGKTSLYLQSFVHFF